MVAKIFCVDGSKQLKIGILNIHHVRNKLETTIMQEWLHDHDIVFICETGTNLPINVPGFNTIYGNTLVANRGGVIFLIKNYLYNMISEVDISVNDQIWFALKCFPSVIFGGCYIPPADSIYYNEHGIANILGKCADYHTKMPVVFGDFNARMAPIVNQLAKGNQNVLYTPIDNITYPNVNGRSLLPVLLECDLLVLNNLTYYDKQFSSGLTYRQRTRWISELDLFILPEKLIPAVCDLVVDQRLSIPSDHAPVSITLSCDMLKPTYQQSLPGLLECARELGDHAVLHNQVTSPVADSGPPRRLPLRTNHTDYEVFKSTLAEVQPSAAIDVTADIDTAVDQFCDLVYNTAAESRPDPVNSTAHVREAMPGARTSHDRWQRILDTNDDRLLWEAIDWKGDIRDSKANHPPDLAFKQHLEEVMNPDNISHISPNDYDTDIYVPILDDPIEPAEVDHVLKKQIKSNKGPGLDGLSPLIFKYLPVQWILMLTVILNNIFYAGYPASWTFSKVKMLFKKGDRMVCDNYRSISIINCMTKIYDYCLYNRLTRWFTPDREQAGALPGRSCIEHIVTLRLIMNYCFKRKTKLFVAFVDFSKAYDRVPRNRLIHTLRQLGCGFMMLFAIATMYMVTKSVLGTTVITAMMGVRQGSPTSCFLFIVFVNTLIKMLKDRCPHDGFLKFLHVLMLMDDTVILATSRNSLEAKLGILSEFCVSHGMIMNSSKTKFMAVNGDARDKEPFDIAGFIIEHCSSYVYLGSVFTSDGSTKSAIEEQYRLKVKHLQKLINFLMKNSDFPFSVKRRVVEAAFNAAILYGCESWLGASCQIMDKLYITAVKCLLGVRKTTANDLCLAEIGLPSLQSLVRHKQQTFIKNMINKTASIHDDPFRFALDLTHAGNVTLSRYINNILTVNNHIAEANDNLHERIRTSIRTKFVTYYDINPTMVVPNVYAVNNRSIVPEHYRIAFTRLRLSSHNLKIETGRWSRIPRERRLCQCGSVQDERHVLELCARTEHLRGQYPQSVAYPQILRNAQDKRDFKYFHDVLTVYQ